MILFMLAFMFEFVYKEKQALILVIKMLYLNFHFIDFSGFDVFFKSAYDLILFFNLGLEVLDYGFEAYNKSVASLLYIVIC